MITINLASLLIFVLLVVALGVLIAGGLMIYVLISFVFRLFMH